MVGAPWSEPAGTERTWTVPEGILLFLPLLAVAVLPLLVAGAVVLAADLAGIGTRLLAALSVAAGLVLWIAGAGPAWDAYVTHGLPWNFAGSSDPWAHLRAALAFAVPAGLVLAAAFSIWRARLRPFWVEESPRRGVLSAPRARRALAQLQRDVRETDGSVGLGLDPLGRAVSLSPFELVQHALIVGATGSGKTTTLLRLLAALMGEGGGIVVVDLKADPALAEALSSFAEARGRPFELWSLDGPTFWNPLARGNPTELTDKLVALEEWTEPHYKRAAQRYLHTLLKALADAGEEPELERVAELLDPEALVAFAVTSSRVGDDDRARVERYAENLDRSSASAVQGLANRLAFLAETAPGAYLRSGADGIDLGRTLVEGRVTLFSLDAQTYGETAGHLAALVALDLRTVAGERLACGSCAQAFVAFDEFSAMRSDHLAHLFARGRGAGIGVLLATQELADLTRVAPAFADQVLANTNVKVIHRQDVPESAERLAGLAGTRTVYEETLQMDRTPFRRVGDRVLGGEWGRNTGRGTIRRVEEYVVHPNLLKQLPCGDAVVIRKHPQVRVDRVAVVPWEGGRS